MRLIALKCPECGGAVELDGDREFGFCIYCGVKIAIVNDRVAGASSRGDDAVRWTNMAAEAYQSGDYPDAYRYAKMATESDDAIPDPWYIRAACAHDRSEVRFCLRRFLATCDADDSRRAQCEELLGEADPVSASEPSGVPSEEASRPIKVDILFPPEPLRLKGSFSYFGTMIDGRDCSTAGLNQRITVNTRSGEHVIAFRQVNIGMLGGAVVNVERKVFLRQGQIIDVTATDGALDFDIHSI